MFMATSAGISVDDYIATYVNRHDKPAFEYIDGVLRPRGMGTRKHSAVQARLVILIAQNYPQFAVFPELHTRPRATEFLIPDVAVEHQPASTGDYPGPDNPVFLCVEILSPPDRIGKMLAKCEEYHEWGVPHCWVLDPEEKTAWQYSKGEQPRKLDEPASTISAGPIQLPLASVFENI